uniref:Uncharacterized protein n=1 Tax=Opuntia streptacantha TaxID=393608 RepID=A0A7C9D7H9_OPUST
MPPCSASQTYFPTSNLHGYGTKSPTFYGQYTLFSSPSRLRPAFALYRPAGLHPPPFFQSICLKLSSTGRRFTLHQRQICLKLDLLLLYCDNSMFWLDLAFFTPHRHFFFFFLNCGREIRPLPVLSRPSRLFHSGTGLTPSFRPFAVR